MSSHRTLQISHLKYRNYRLLYLDLQYLQPSVVLGVIPTEKKNLICTFRSYASLILRTDFLW